jgi:hypothetical protein
MAIHHKITPALPSALSEAQSLVVQAAALIEKADLLLVGYRHYDEHTDRTSWPAEDGVDVSALRSCLDSYLYYIRNGVRVPVDMSLGAAQLGVGRVGL